MEERLLVICWESVRGPRKAFFWTRCLCRFACYLDGDACRRDAKSLRAGRASGGSWSRVIKENSCQGFFVNSDSCHRGVFTQPRNQGGSGWLIHPSAELSVFELCFHLRMTEYVHAGRKEGTRDISENQPIGKQVWLVSACWPCYIHTWLNNSVAATVPGSVGRVKGLSGRRENLIDGLKVAEQKLGF